MRRMHNPLVVYLTISVLLYGQITLQGAPFTIVALPDTQNYCDSDTLLGGFIAQTNWVVNNAAARNIRLVTGLGDIVNNGGNLTLWNRADQAVDILDSLPRLPYAMPLGNHDYNTPGNLAGGAANYVSYFGAARYAGRSWYGGSSSDQLNHYQTFYANGRKYLHIALEYDARSSSIAWAQSILNANPTTPTIISTHDYLTLAGTRSTSAASGGNSPEQIYQQLVHNNPQVFMVLSGHYHGEARLTSTNAAGKPVFQLLSDYQDYSNGGDGWLRNIELDEAAGEIRVQTYTPGVPLNPNPRYKTDPSSQFTLPLDFVARFGAAPYPVEAANIRIVQNWAQYTGGNGWGDKSSATVTVPQGTPNFSMPDWNTGDFYPAVGGQYLNLNNGVLVATVRNNGRDNGDGYGMRYGTVETTCNVGPPWGPSAWLATNPAGNDNNMGDELNIDLAAAWFPYAGDWTGANVDGATIRSSSLDISTANLTKPATGQWYLTLPGVDSRAGGLVFANGGSNSNNFAAAGASADGTRFELQLRDNYSSGQEDGPLAFVYIPYDTGSLVMGRVSGLGGLYNRSGNFTIRREGVGTFRLSIPGQDPTTGMLLLTSDATSIANDNIISYEADGSDFVIQSRDINNGQPAALQDIGAAPAFSFAFIPFATPPVTPGGRSFNATSQVAAANLQVTEYGSGDAGENLHVQVTEGTGYLSTPLWTKGDYQVYQNGLPIPASAGVLLASVRENGRANPATAADTRYSIVATNQAGGTWQVSTHWAGYPTWPGEWNVNVAVAYFPYAAGWQGGLADNAPNNNGEMNSFIGSSDIQLGVNLIDVSGGQGGEYYLWLKKNAGADNVNAFKDGIVFANGGKDENNFAAAGPSADGSYFVLETHDSDSGGNENDPISFAYIPYDTPGVPMGRVSGVGGLYNRAGDFTLRRTATGTYRLSIPGQSPTTGMLLLNVDALSNASDKAISYQADGDDFVIEVRDWSSNTVPTLVDLGNTPAFNFAFIPFNNPPTAPGVRNFDPTAQVAAANLQVTEITPGTAPGENRVEVIEGSGYLTTPTYTRGDIAVYQNGVPADPTQGVLLATVRDHLRDNSATGGKSDYGVVDVYTAGGGYSLAATTLDPRFPGQQTHNIDVAVAYFPFAMGFAGGVNYAVPGGSTTLTIPGSGDTRRSGVLLATGSGTGPDDNIATVQPLTDGSGWNIRLQDNSTAPEADWINYVFLPYGTENLVAGQVSAAGYLVNKTGQFSLVREGTGLYRLSIPGQSPQTGMLLLNATQAGASNDNTVVYKADGNDFLIRGIDLQTDNTHAPEDTDFHFAFIGFNNPPRNPQLRTINPNALAAANIHVIQRDTGDTSTSVSAYTEQSTPAMTVHNANKGTFWLSVDGQPLDANAGVVVSSVRQNGRDNADGQGNWFAQSVTVRDGSTYYVNTYRVSAGLYATTEHNIDVAAVYFPFAGGWQAGHAMVSTNGGPITSLVATPGINLGTEFIDGYPSGQFQLRLPGVNALSDGVVFANHGKNEGNYAMAGPAADGSHFAIRVHDCGTDGSGTEQDPVAFAYIPYDTPGIVSGRVSGEGGLFNGSGTFTVRREGVGTFRLSIPGHSPTTGALLVTGDPWGTNAADNVVSYQADGNDWIIQSRDLNANPPPLEDTFNQAAFSFAFIPFDNPPTAPGGRTFDPTAQVAAANFRVIQNNTGGNPDAVHAEVAEGSGFLTAAYWNRGDFQLRQNGRVINLTQGALLASVREDQRDNAGEPAGALGLVDVNYKVDFGGVQAPGTATHRAGNSYGGEMNVNYAVAYFPFAQGWLGGYVTGNDGTADGSMQAILGAPGLVLGTHVIDSPSTNGMYDVYLPGSGDTRRSGLLMVTAGENENNAASVACKADGSGWTVNVVDNSQNFENDDVSFVFIPYGAKNLVAAEINEQGYMDNSTGNLYGFRTGTGTYRLRVPGGSPTQGMLLLTPVSSTNSANQDNFLTYAADGNEFVIRAYDLGNPTPTLQDTRFWVTYVPFDNPPSDPQLRVIDPASVAAANLRIVQNDTGNTSASVTVTTPEGTPGLYIWQANAGDFYLARDGAPLNLNQGVLMATVRNLGRDNGDGLGLRHATVEVSAEQPANAWLATDVAGSTSAELNLDLAAAWFPFSGSWAGAHMNAAGTVWASNGISQSMFTKIANGRYQLRLPGIDAVEDGMLFAIGGSNSNRVVTAAVLDDHSGWELAVRGNDQDSGAYTQDDFSVLYVPYMTKNLIGGLVDETGTIVRAAGQDLFTLTRLGLGEYLLSIEDQSPESGMLLLTAAKMLPGGVPEDNFLAYEAFGEDFLIRSYDLPGVTLQDTDFVFAFVSFTESLAIPEPAGVTLLLLGLGLLVGFGRRRRGR